MKNKKQNLVVFTGAGISAESGIRTFRDANGLWENYRIEEVATPAAWVANPARVLDFYNQRRKDVKKAQPNAAHLSLVQLEDYYQTTIITQNIDDLHERAGSQNVIHLHGEIMKSRSSNTDAFLYDCPGDILPGDLCEFGYQLRPHVVWFNEPVPMMELAIEVSMEADIFIVIGSSLQVYPAAGLIRYAPSRALKYLVDPNIPEAIPVKNMEMIAAKASEGVPMLVNQLIARLT